MSFADFCGLRVCLGLRALALADLAHWRGGFGFLPASRCCIAYFAYARAMGEFVGSGSGVVKPALCVTGPAAPKCAPRRPFGLSGEILLPRSAPRLKLRLPANFHRSVWQGGDCAGGGKV